MVGTVVRLPVGRVVFSKRFFGWKAASVMVVPIQHDDDIPRDIVSESIVIIKDPIEPIPCTIKKAEKFEL